MTGRARTLKRRMGRKPRTEPTKNYSFRLTEGELGELDQTLPILGVKTRVDALRAMTRNTLRQAPGKVDPDLHAIIRQLVRLEVPEAVSAWLLANLGPDRKK